MNPNQLLAPDFLQVIGIQCFVGPSLPEIRYGINKSNIFRLLYAQNNNQT